MAFVKVALISSGLLKSRAQIITVLTASDAQIVAKWEEAFLDPDQGMLLLLPAFLN